MKHLVLIDGHHMMYRAYWAIPRTLKTSKGEQVNTVFGIASMLITLLNAEKPDSLLFCFDEGEDTLRHQEHKEYKEGRAATPDDFYVQIPRVIELIDAFGFKHVSNPQFEADDLLASYAVAAAKEGMKASIISGDKDVLQMADTSIQIVIPHKGYQAAEYLGAKEVEAKYGFRPDQVASFKGLSGDSSDNLPGVQGIGPKTAVKLLQEYGSLQGIYDHIDEIKGGVKDKLLKDREQAFFCERMAVLNRDLPLTVPLEDLTLEKVPAPAVQSFFQTMEFSLLTKRLQSLVNTDYGQAHFQPLAAAISAPQKVDKKDQLAMFE